MALSTVSSSSSSSSDTSPWRYDVFLSFRGDDTRNTFTAHLYIALNRKGILTYLDEDELRRGDEISPALFQAIEGSRIFIIVLSKNYASSIWCLDELLKMLDQSKKSKQQRVLPVFYHVDPSDVRHQRESFGEALAKHAEKLNVDHMKLQLWKAALQEVANLSGYHLIRNGRLREKCLISVEYFDGKLQMHDLLRDMGREVVRQESPNNPGERSRLFFHKDVREVLEKDIGTDRVEAIVVDFPEGDDIIRLSPKAFKNMKRLRLFRCHNAHFSGEPNCLPNSISVLDWPNCPLQSMPPEFCGDKLFILRMPSSRIQEIHLEFKAEMIFPGKKIPDWFNHCKEIASNSHRCEFDIKVAPPYKLDDIIGIAFCAVIEPLATITLDVSIIRGDTYASHYWDAHSNFDEIDSDHVWLRYLTTEDIMCLRAVSVDQADDLRIIFESTQNLVDNMRIIFESKDPNSMIFKRCGVHLLYKQHEQNAKDHAGVPHHENIDVHLNATIEDIGNLANLVGGSQLSKRCRVDYDGYEDDHNIESNLYAQQRKPASTLGIELFLIDSNSWSRKCNLDP